MWNRISFRGFEDLASIFDIGRLVYARKQIERTFHEEKWNLNILLRSVKSRTFGWKLSIFESCCDLIKKN